MSGRVALVTGATAGIGRACAVRLAQDGMAVGVLDLTPSDETVAAITAAGGRALAVQASVADRAAVKAAADAVRAAFGPITVVVNNAGVTDFTPFEQTSEEIIDRVYAVNVKGVFFVTQEVLPDMKAAGWGRIVNISSSSAQTGAIGMSAYSSSKGAVVTLTRTLAQEFGPLGITCNHIPPGSVMQTIMSEANRAKFQMPEEQLIQAIPVRRLGEPADIANACAWLASDASGYVTGQTIGVNGGRVLA